MDQFWFVILINGIEDTILDCLQVCKCSYAVSRYLCHSQYVTYFLANEMYYSYFRLTWSVQCVNSFTCLRPGVTCQQRMPTPLWHLTLPLIFRNPCLLCSCFVSFLWTFDFKHCSSHVIHQDNFSSITYPSTRSAMPKVVILSDTIYGFVRFVDSIFEYCTRLVRTKRAIKCIHSFVLCQET